MNLANAFQCETESSAKINTLACFVSQVVSDRWIRHGSRRPFCPSPLKRGEITCVVITPTILLFITNDGLWKALAELEPVKDVIIHEDTPRQLLHFIKKTSDAFFWSAEGLNAWMKSWKKEWRGETAGQMVSDWKVCATFLWLAWRHTWVIRKAVME